MALLTTIHAFNIYLQIFNTRFMIRRCHFSMEVINFSFYPNFILVCVFCPTLFVFMYRRAKYIRLVYLSFYTLDRLDRFSYSRGPTVGNHRLIRFVTNQMDPETFNRSKTLLQTNVPRFSWATSSRLGYVITPCLLCQSHTITYDDL